LIHSDSCGIKMPIFYEETINKVDLFQFYLIKVSYYEIRLHNNFAPFKYLFKKKYQEIIAGLMSKIEDMLKNDPWLVNITSNFFKDEQSQLQYFPKLYKMSADKKNKYAKLINRSCFPLQLVISLENYSLAKILIKQYGASVGACDINDGTTILDDLEQGRIKINDPELIQLLINKRANRGRFQGSCRVM
jgi:hypothetical protein